MECNGLQDQKVEWFGIVWNGMEWNGLPKHEVNNPNGLTKTISNANANANAKFGTQKCKNAIFDI